MRIRFEPSIHEYINMVEPLLLEKEACNNLMLGILNQFRQNGHQNDSDCNLGIAEVNGTAVFAFMQTPPNNWILADVNIPGEAVIKQTARFIHDSKVGMPGFMGTPVITAVFRDEWERITERRATAHMEQLIYRLDHIHLVARAEGQMVQARRKDHALVKKWLKQFGMEANERISDEKAAQLAESFIEGQSAYLWKVDDQPVSMANRSRTTRNGATINAVFTPDEYKQNGYATAVVQALSQKLFHDGFNFCSLFTDLHNPTSNSIYQKIGYYEVGSSIVYNLKSS